MLKDLIYNSNEYINSEDTDLAEKINSEGTTEQYQNGKNQHGMKMSADIQAYNQTAKIYHNLMIKLRERLPKEQSGSLLAEMMLDDE